MMEMPRIFLELDFFYHCFRRGLQRT
jgi:hypothetical protein